MATFTGHLLAKTLVIHVFSPIPALLILKLVHAQKNRSKHLKFSQDFNFTLISYAFNFTYYSFHNFHPLFFMLSPIILYYSSNLVKIAYGS